MTTMTLMPNEDEDNRGNTVAGPTVLAHVDMAKTARSKNQFFVPAPLLIHLHRKTALPDVVTERIGQPDLVNLIQHFLSGQCRHPDSDSDTNIILLGLL